MRNHGILYQICTLLPPYVSWLEEGSKQYYQSHTKKNCDDDTRVNGDFKKIEIYYAVVRLSEFFFILKLKLKINFFITNIPLLQRQLTVNKNRKYALVGVFFYILRQVWINHAMTHDKTRRSNYPKIRIAPPPTSSANTMTHYWFKGTVSRFLLLLYFTPTDCWKATRSTIIFVVPETWIMYLSVSCTFLNCSVSSAVYWGGVHYVPLFQKSSARWRSWRPPPFIFCLLISQTNL